MFLFGKRFYAPLYVAVLILIGMILIYISESFGISQRNSNIDLRKANSIILADKSLKKQVKNSLEYTSSMLSNLDNCQMNSMNENCLTNKKYNKITLSNSGDAEKIKRINMILINSVA